MNPSTPVLSVIIPVYNEAQTLPALIERAETALRRVGLPFELVIVNDASTDETESILASRQGEVRTVNLRTNRGQLGATKAGLVAAQGRIVVVLDGDLQDPPEPIPDLIRTLRQSPRLDAVFMCKANAGDPPWMRSGRAVYRALQAVPGAANMPYGSGSFVAMRAPLAQRIAHTRVTDGNLAALICGLGVRVGSLPYARAPRPRGTSHVGFVGLVREAVSSLVITGALAAWLRILAVAGLAFAAKRRSLKPIVVVLLTLFAARRSDAQRRRRLSGRS